MKTIFAVILLMSTINASAQYEWEEGEYKTNLGPFLRIPAPNHLT